MAKHSASGSRWLATAAGVAAGVYGAYIGVTWARYGQPAPPAPDEEDPLLDHFMPQYDVVERHRVRVDAPAGTTLDVASDLDLFDLPAVRAIFKGRELLLGSSARRTSTRARHAGRRSGAGLGRAGRRSRTRGRAGRGDETMGGEPRFRSVPPDDFRDFAEPDYVKIAWTLRADPAGRGASIFRTETRAVATDAAARSRFRAYWSLLSPGIFLIRWLSLGPVKAGAERRASASRAR